MTNKRKPDDEFAQINLSYYRADGTEVMVLCPESQGAIATQQPFRRHLGSVSPEAEGTAAAGPPVPPVAVRIPRTAPETPGGAPATVEPETDGPRSSGQST